MPPFFDIHGDPTMDPYTILSLPHTASDAEIKKAYRMKMLQLHPDKLAPTLSDQSIANVTEKFHNVKDAYEFLTSPVHLTSRRLYMAKMASRRAEYERREAFMRRHQNAAYTASAFTTGGVKSYHTGGGGAAGMAGTGVPTAAQHARNGSHRRSRTSGKSHAVPSRERARRGRDARGRTGMYNCHNTARRNGYKSNGYRSEGCRSDPKPRHREGRRKEARSDKRKEKEKRQRAKSENRHHSPGRTKWGKARDERRARSREDRERFEAKRRRARSAPARYAEKTAKHYRGDKYGRNSDLPREFFCPLTKRLMKDPVRDGEGNVYEREAIERWLRVQSSSPITNGHLSVEMLRPDKELKRAIYKATGKPRSRSQVRSKTRSKSPSKDLVSGRVLIDSYLREISTKSKLSVSLDGMGICAFSYRRITFVIEVPITPHAGFMVYSSFDGEMDKHKLTEKINAWNAWFGNIGRHSCVSYVKAGQKTVFTLKGSEKDMGHCDTFQKILEYFVEMSLKLHNLLHPADKKAVENVCLTREPVSMP
ncbi:hypothetical protein ACHAXT_007032 [Thalassiosira profunda]